MIGKRLIARFCLVCLLLFSFLTVSGCGEDEVRTAPLATVKKAKAPVQKAPAELVEEGEEEPQLKFVYSPSGKRDPFEPLVKKDIKPKVTGVPLTPLQKFDLGQFRLQAILIGKGEPHAMVGAPDGKTYILTPGIKIGKKEGVVLEITRESVQVEEVHYDVTGAATRKLATIDMPEQKSF